MTLVLSFVAREFSWIHVHDALMFGKYGLIAILAVTVRSGRTMLVVFGRAIAFASVLVAILTILQSFQIPAINMWTFSTFLSTRGGTDAEVTELSLSYLRAYGMVGPSGSAALLAMSLGAWFVLVIKPDSVWWLRAAAVGMSLVLSAIYLTGSRLGVLVSVPMLAMGVVWAVSAKSDLPVLRMVSATFVISLLVVVAMSQANASFGATAKTSNERITNAIPAMLNGEPDASTNSRMDEYVSLDVRGATNWC